MTLFDDQPTPQTDEAPDADAPLAERLRPRRLGELLGQGRVVGDDGFLARAIAEDRVPSLVF
ncbi:MAG TPA: hypothetical protein VKU40_01740, partial [Thermoanaerobaculia bacterium]|nr:hypothetical protein [Thermoanaerobaculia bacterium]